MVNRKEIPKVSLTTELPLIKPLADRLDNGLPVYYLEGGTEEILKVEMVFFAGSFFQLKPLIAYATGNLLRSGTESKARREINELLDYYSAHIHIEAQKDIISVTMFVLNKHFDPAFKLFCEMIRKPVFPEEEMRVYLNNQRQIHLINQKKVQHLARTYFNELVYGEAHPYGYRTRADDFEKVDRQDLRTFHGSFFHPVNAFCVVSGRLPSDITARVSTGLGGIAWQQTEATKPPVYRMLSSGSRKMHLDMPGALQSAIRIGKQLINRTHPAWHRLKITNALLGGFYGSRLMQNIRQDKGFTYGISSALVSLVRSGYFFIGTQVGTDVCKPALEEIYKELKSLRTIPARNEELQTLKNYLSGNYLRSFDGPFAQAARFKEMLVFGLDMSHHEDFLKELKSITAEDIMETAGLYLREDEMMEVVVG
jgi:zinc protease